MTIIGSFSGINIALDALRAAQTGQYVTADNISNANTEGYVRRRANLQENVLLKVERMPGGLGTGVTIPSVSRLNDPYADRAVRNALGDEGFASARNTALRALSVALNEPSDNGIAASLNKFLRTWQDLAANPTSNGARNAVAAAGASLGDAMRLVAGGFANQYTIASDQLTARLGDLNQAAADLHTVNEQIESLGSNSSNSLLDQRDMLLERLAAMGASTTSFDSWGRATVSFGAMTLVQPDVTPSAVTLVDVQTQVGSNALTTGSLAGLYSAAQNADPTVTGSAAAALDTLASQILSAFNAQHAAGVTAAGNPGGTLFTGASAATLAFSTTIKADPNLLAAGTTTQPLGGGNALVLAGLGDSGLTNDVTSLVGRIGADGESARIADAAAQARLDAVRQQQQQASGVSLDEEMANMIKYQTAYSAAARVMSTLDQMLQTVLEIR